MGFYGKGLGIGSDADLPQGVTQSGFGTRMYIADQSDYNAGVVAGGENRDKVDLSIDGDTPTEAETAKILKSYYQQEYEGVNFGVIQNAPPIVPGRIRADRSPIPNERGRIDVSGGISMQGNVDVMLPFWKHAFMEVGDGGLYLPNDGENLNKWKDRPDIDAQYQYPWIPGTRKTMKYSGTNGDLEGYDVDILTLAAEIDVVNDTAIIAGWVQPDDTIFGATGTGDDDAAKAADKKAREDGVFVDNTPVKLEFYMTKASVANGITEIKFEGMDQNGTIISERYKFTTPQGTADDNYDVVGPYTISSTADLGIRSRHYYQKLTRVEFSGLTGNADKHLRIQGRNYKKATRFVPRTNLTDGLSLYIIKGGIPQDFENLTPDEQAVAIRIYGDKPKAIAAYAEGGIPNVYLGCLINTLTFSFGETITMDMEFIGRNGYPRVTPGMIKQYGRNFGKVHIAGDAPKGTDGKDPIVDQWNFKGAQDAVYLGWEGGVQIREPGSDKWETIPCTDMGFSINNNLSHPERYWFRRFHVKPNPTDQMELMIDATIDYNTAQGYDFLQQENFDVEARAIAFYRTTGGDEFFTKIDLGRAQINQAMDPSVGGSDIITQTFNLKASSRNKNSDDIYEANPVVVDIGCHTQLPDLRVA